MKVDWIIAGAITIAVAAAGSAVTQAGLPWFETLRTPSWAPPGLVISTAWTIIYVLTTIAAVISWRKSDRGSRTWWIILLFIINALLNAFWTYLFFGLQQMGVSVLEINILNLTTIILFILIWPVSRAASLLLVPYIAWVSFATFLAYTVWMLNR